MYTHRIYGKLKTGKYFKAMNLHNGQFVGNLIYASMLTKEQATMHVAYMNKYNPNMIFEAREMSKQLPNERQE